MAGTTSSLKNLGQGAPEMVVELSYIADNPIYDTEKPYTIDFDVPLEDERHRTNLAFKAEKVRVKDLRAQRSQIDIDCHGFELIDVPTDLLSGRFATMGQIDEMSGVATLLKNRFSTEHVYCFTQRVPSVS